MNHQIDCRHRASFLAGPGWRRLLRIISAVAAAAVLAGCSTIKLGYNTLPDIAYWWLDGYLDFSDEQTPRVHEELTRLHAWHRKNELPHVAEMLGRMEQLAPGPVTGAQGCALVAEAQARMNVVAEQAEPAVVSLAATLSARQLRHLERKFGKKNAEWRRESVDAPADERLERRVKRWTERLEMIYGRLEEPQRAVLRRSLAQSIYDPPRVFAELQRRQADLLRTLRQVQERPGDTAAARTLMRSWLQRAQQSPDADYRRYQQALLDEGCGTVAAVHESTNAEQRARAVRRLRGYRRDVLDLAGP